tara:strand:- start:5 stop:877 length:873 start_codon:yes stop_codon:yes gene_type:complete
MGLNEKFFASATPAANSPDMSNATFVNAKTLTIGTRGFPRGAFISFDGTRLFTTHLDTSNNDWLQQYNFGTAFDVTTVGTVAKEKQLSATILSYMAGVSGNLDNTWITYDPYHNTEYYSQPFGTAGDISTIGTLYTNDCTTRTTSDLYSQTQMISKDGNKTFGLTGTPNMITKTLSTNNDLSSATTNCGTSVNVNSIGTSLGSTLSCFNFNQDGTKYYQFARNAKVATFDLSTPWNVSTRSNQVTTDLSSALGSPQYNYALQFNNSYTKMIILTRNQTPSVTYKLQEFNL